MTTEPIGLPTSIANQRLYIDGFIHALCGMESKTDKPAYTDGYETGRLVFVRLAGETLGQARAFLDMDIEQLRSQDAPDEFQRETRLLGFFGRLHRAADALARSQDGGSKEWADLRAALSLPPDLEAALEGPRGRAMTDD